MIERAIIDNATEWLMPRIPSALASTVAKADIVEALITLSELPNVAATFLIPDLFPKIDLEVLYVHDIDSSIKDVIQKQKTDERCSVPALTAIGAAIRNEMVVTGTEVMTFKPDGLAELIVFPPRVRAAVLHATGTTLLPTVS